MMRAMRRISLRHENGRGVRAKKSLGQNFLMHPRIAERIVKTAELSPGAVVCEIGPGRGILTRALLARADRVIAVEADEELFTKLWSDFAGEISSGHLELIHDDIRTFDISALPKGYVLVASIPYYLTGDIFRRFLESQNQPSQLTFLVQKEVAHRIARSKKESILSLSVKAYGEPKYEFSVPRGAFLPMPNVDSAVLSVRHISRQRFSAQKEERIFFALVRAGFAHKRKFVRNNLTNAGFHAGDIPDKARAEDVPLSMWFNVAKR